MSPQITSRLLCSLTRPTDKRTLIAKDYNATTFIASPAVAHTNKLIQFGAFMQQVVRIYLKALKQPLPSPPPTLAGPPDTSQRPLPDDIQSAHKSVIVVCDQCLPFPRRVRSGLIVQGQYPPRRCAKRRLRANKAYQLVSFRCHAISAL